MPKFLTSQAAEAAFYAAFEAADLETMMQIWAQSEKVACTHPMGPCLHGRDVIEQSWKTVFSEGARMTFSLTMIQQNISSDMAVHVLYENISLRDSAHLAATPVVCTNIYKLIEGNWQMILHHASLTPLDVDAERQVRH
ncbi:MAG: nuclear transport factor 2 family protein [Thiotrichaceae bacterium]|nr:nuclear transport factor 2 family protein [Thiotrichaceae bacterium]